MADRRIDGFFYGLFMDAAILRERHVEPVDPRRAYVDHYALRIGQRATLVPAPGERSYGVVMALTHAELDRLYAAPGLEDYRPEAVVAQCLNFGPVPALCYTLLEAPEAGESNRTYAAQLRAVLEALAFPPEYVASVTTGMP